MTESNIEYLYIKIPFLSLCLKYLIHFTFLGKFTGTGKEKYNETMRHNKRNKHYLSNKVTRVNMDIKG